MPAAPDATLLDEAPADLVAPAPAAPGLVAAVLIPIAMDQCYSYSLGDLDLQPGDVVEVPLGPRPAVGVVWSLEAPEGSGRKLKPVAAKLDLAPVPERLRRFIEWVSRWTLSPRGMVLRMCLRVPLTVEPAAPRLGVVVTDRPPAKPTAARERVLGAASDVPLMAKGALAVAAGCTVAVVNALIAEGSLALTPIPPEPLAVPDPAHAAPLLNPDQREAAAALVETVGRRAGVVLLEGVTGSGKTEVYFEAVAEALRQGRQALILLPEIALTAAFLDRFAARFGARPVEWHSAVTPRRRGVAWHAVASGEARVIVGARSALFLPYPDLGLIVVDEEHEAAYKQEDGVAYHARDMAVVRGQLEQAPVVLASATPSLETQTNARIGRYQHLRLAGRFNERALPAVAAIDLKRDPPPRGRFIAPALERAVNEAIGRGEQALLFLNRRGYAPLTLCRACGHRFGCPNCSSWLVEHRFRHALLCHHCGHSERRPAVCPSCEAAGSLVACGPGVERLAEEVATVFPEARAMVLSSDMGGTERLRAELEAVADGECDIVIGTQLVAKGHNFPLLTLVGVIDADISLSSGDPRAAERTFQLLQQVTGRAGRHEKEGRAFLQTWQPEHPVMVALRSGEAERFYAEEVRSRSRAGLPPFGRLAAIIVSGPDFSATQAHARALAQAAFRLGPSERWTLAAAGGLPQRDDTVLLGPAEAPIGLISGRHRFRLLVKAPRRADVQGFLRALAEAAPPARAGIRVGYDVDPQSFL